LSSNTQEFYTLLTNSGIEALIKAKEKNKDIKLSKMAVSDNENLPSCDMTILEDEKYRFDINSIFQDSINPHHLILEGVIPGSVGGFDVCSIGIYTNDGVLFAVGKVPKTYKPLLEQGASKDLTIKVVLEISNSANVTLKVDDGVVLATKEYLSSQLKKYAFINGDRTNTFKVAPAQNENEAVNKKQLDLIVNDLNSVVANTIETINASQNTANKGASGWFKDSSTGIILQWGYTSIWDRVYTFSFPIAFPNAGLCLTFGFADYEGIPRGGIVSKTHFKIWASRSIRSEFYYLAIGY